MRPRGSVFQSPFPLALNLTWVWAWVVVLILLGLPWTWAHAAGGQPQLWAAIDQLWLESPIPRRICLTGILLVVWLWVSHRTDVVHCRPAGWVTVLGLLAAGVTVLVIALGLLAATQAGPAGTWVLKRVHP